MYYIIWLLPSGVKRCRLHAGARYNPMIKLLHAMKNMGRGMDMGNSEIFASPEGASKKYKKRKALCKWFSHLT